jgi:hypothetical protein
MNMREPGIFQAASLTENVCCKLIFLVRKASNTKYAVINLVKDAGSTGVSACRCAKTCPAVMSNNKYALAAISGGSGVWANTLADKAAINTTHTRKKFMNLPIEKKAACHARRCRKANDFNSGNCP